MKCGFCGIKMAENTESDKDTNIDQTCWGCGAGYTNGKLVEYAHVGAPWKLIPDGCLMVINLEIAEGINLTEEIK